MMQESNKVRLIEDDIYSSLENTMGSSYDKKARIYERLVGLNIYNKILWGTLPKDYTDFAKAAILVSKGKCIDIGCGGLIQTAGIYAQTKQDYILLDHSIEMLRIAKSRLVSQCGMMPGHIRLLQADAFQLPFEDENFDNLVSFGMIHCFEDKSAFISEALRVLKRGGTFHFTSMTSDRLISKHYMNLLRKQKEFGVPLGSGHIVKLFKDNVCDINFYMKGSMIFISGKK